MNILKYFGRLLFVIITAPTSDLLVQLSNKATQSTLDYIEKNKLDSMLHFRTKDAIYKYVSNKISDGLILEFGVYTGGSVNKLAKLSPKRTIFGFDSFEGLPEDWSGHSVKSYFKINKLPKVRKNVTLLKGWFDDTLPEFVKKHDEKIALLHVDCDLYSSTKTIFDHLKNQITDGTIIIFDEYWNYPNWKEHEFKAFNEFLSKSEFTPEYLCCYPRGTVAVLIKSKNSENSV